MAATTLNPNATRYFYHGNLQLPPPPPPQHMRTMGGQYHAPPPFSMPFPVVADYPLGPVLVPPPMPMYAFLPPPQPVLAGHFLFTPTALMRSTAPKRLPGKNAPSPPVPLNSKAAPSPPVPLSSKVTPSPPVPLSSKAAPSSPPTSAPVPSSCEAPKVPALPLPHGMAPHWFYRWGDVDVEKKQAQAAAMARAAQPVKPVKEEAPARFPAPAPRPSGPRGQKRAKLAEKRRNREVWHQQAKAPVVLACKPPASSPSPSTVSMFTTSPPTPMSAPEWGERQVTTVMIRNIPNRLKPGEMLQLLDDHCAHANGDGDGVPAAYDFLYLPMDFSNLGYAFVNLTTPEAARGLHYALHGARWVVFGSSKVIDICAARIQGKKKLVEHFVMSTFPCHDDDFLPTVFSPPRPAAGSVATLVGTRVAPSSHTPPPATARAQWLAGKPVARGRRQACCWVVKTSSTSSI